MSESSNKPVLIHQKELQEVMESFVLDVQLSERHCKYVNFVSRNNGFPNSYRSIDDANYEPPTLEEFCDVVNHLAAIHSLGTVSKMLGIYGKTDANKTIKRWKDGTSRIPYAAWRLLLILDGRVVQTNRLPELTGEKLWKVRYE